MRILSASIQNFASYKELDFDFQNQGLTLIQGPTGSGKSTLCDVVPWVLFGRTAKGGTVDEILSWPGDEITKGTIVLENVTIVRIRGSKAKDNDLYFIQDISSTVEKYTRGKDLNDTQKMINNLLGMDYELYLAGAYLHEFSQTSQFFTTTAKNRRVICEQIVDLTMAKKLQLKLAEDYKATNKIIGEQSHQIQKLGNEINTLKRIEALENIKSSNWNADHVKAQEKAFDNHTRFEQTRQATLDSLRMGIEDDLKLKKDAKICSECGSTIHKGHTPKTDYYEARIEDETNKENPYAERLLQLEAEVNPYTNGVVSYTEEIEDLQNKLAMYQGFLVAHEMELADNELLQQVTNDFRSVSITNTIDSIENNTNKLLTDHFDAEIKVRFDVADADKLDVTIMKDGNMASFTQLSKGQRCLLKLCFGISVMQAVQTHHGLRFFQIFLDEALDGLDDTMKIKAYGLLMTITQSYESVFVVEHSEALKALFENSFSVSLVNGSSELGKA